MLCTCRNLATGSPLSFLHISQQAICWQGQSLWCCNNSICLLCLCCSPASSSHECRASFIVVNTRINHVCSAWNTSFLTCNEQSVKHDDALKPRPAFTHLHIRHIHSVWRAYRLVLYPDITLTAYVSCRSFACGIKRRCSLSTLV